MEGCVPQRTHWSESPRLHFCPAFCTDFLAVEKIIFQLLSVWPAWRWCGFHLERENISGLHPFRFSPFCTCNTGEHVFTCVGDTPGQPNSTVSYRLKVNTHSPSSGTFSHMPLPQTKPRYRSMCERGCRCLVTPSEQKAEWADRKGFISVIEMLSLFLPQI